MTAGASVSMCLLCYNKYRNVPNLATVDCARASCFPADLRDNRQRWRTQGAKPYLLRTTDNNPDLILRRGLAKSRELSCPCQACFRLRPDRRAVARYVLRWISRDRFRRVPGCGLDRRDRSARKCAANYRPRCQLLRRRQRARSPDQARWRGLGYGHSDVNILPRYRANYARLPRAAVHRRAAWESRRELANPAEDFFQPNVS